MARILIADDEPQVRSALRSILEGAGHEVFETFDGLGALYDLKDLKPDALLLDWMIPELFGGEVLDKIRNDLEYQEVRETPVIVVSDFDDEANRERFLQAGANDFVPKRDNLDQLKEHLLACLGTLLSGKQ